MCVTYLKRLHFSVIRITRSSALRYNEGMTDAVVAEKVKAFFGNFPSRVYEKGEVLIRSGDIEKRIYYLKEGHVRQSTLAKEGEDMTLNVFKSGAFFPMAWITESYRNTYSFEAMDHVVVHIAKYEGVIRFLRDQPDVQYDLLRRLYSGMEGLLSRLEEHMSGDARKRLITNLVICAKRFGEKRLRSIVITLKLTHQDLATMTGLTRETVSREMAQLKKSGHLDYTSATILIKDAAQLESELV
jgi:CRP-like cAMP-binding protein